MPFKTVIKPKSSKGTEDENYDDSLPSSAQKDQEKEDNTEFVNLSETQNEKLKSNQYQQIGQENNATLNQDNKVGLNQQQASDTQVASVDKINSANSSAIQIDRVQAYQGIDNINNAPENSALANSTEQIKGETAKKESGAIEDNSVTATRGVTGQTQVTPAENFGVSGQTEVKPAENFGISGDTGVVVAETFGVTGEKIVLDLPKIGAKGKTATSLSNDPIKSINNYDQTNNLNDNLYRQVGPDGQIISGNKEEIPFNESSASDIENANVNSNITTENNNSFNNEKVDTATDSANRLTFDRMSAADSALQSQDSKGGTNEGISNLDTNVNNSDKAIYESLPQQEYGTQESSSVTEGTGAQGNPNDNINSANLPPGQMSGAKGESVTTVTNIEGATGDKTVSINELSSAKGESGVISREILGTKGETSVNFSDTKGVSGTTLSGVTFDNQLNKGQTTSVDAKKIIINRAGVDSNQNQNLNNAGGQAADNYSSFDSVSTNINPDSRTAIPSETIAISNVGQNARYEDAQTAGVIRSEDQQRPQKNNTKESSKAMPVYKTITNDSGNTYQVDEYGNRISDNTYQVDEYDNRISGNTYQVDEYGNRINDPNYSYEELQPVTDPTDVSTRSTRYSTIDGVRANEQPYDGFSSNSIQGTNSATNYQPNQIDRTGGQSNNNQARATYSPLTSNTSRLSKSENKDSSQSDVKNYNFIQKLSMTINRALGIEPQSAKDEQINLTNADENQEISQGEGLTRVISPRVTGLVESKDLEDEEEERKNKRKQLRYQRVGYIEPDFKAPEPTKLDDETQVFKDLYEDRNRFDYATAETNSALLRRAEEEIEKQSEAAKESNIQESVSAKNENSQDIESVYYIELLKERTRLEQALDDERESNRLAIRKSEDNIQQQLLDLILNGQNVDLDSRSNDPISKLVQTLTDDKNKNSEQVVIDATKIVQMIQNQITESNGSPIDEFLLRKRIEDELRSEFVYMQREQEKKMKLVYRKMLEDMYMDMINN